MSSGCPTASRPWLASVLAAAEPTIGLRPCMESPSCSRKQTMCACWSRKAQAQRMRRLSLMPSLSTHRVWTQLWASRSTSTSTSTRLSQDIHFGPTSRPGLAPDIWSVQCSPARSIKRPLTIMPEPLDRGRRRTWASSGIPKLSPIPADLHQSRVDTRNDRRVRLSIHMATHHSACNAPHQKCSAAGQRQIATLDRYSRVDLVQRNVATP